MPQDKAKAAAFYRQAAELYLMAGDPSENVPEGVKMLEKACGLGDRDAMELLAMRLKTGDGVPMDKARAALLYTRAADCYFGEKETEGHMEKAAVLYQLAAELGDVRAKAIGFYRKGHQRLDPTDGLKWRAYSWLWTRLFPLRRYLLFALHPHIPRRFLGKGAPSIT